MKGRVLCGVHSCWLPSLTLWLCYIIVLTQREAGVRQLLVRADCIPATGCTALVYYTTKPGDSIEFLTNIFQVQYADLLLYSQRSQHDIILGTNLYVPFACTCTNGRLMHTFSYPVNFNDDVETVVDRYYENLTTVNDVIVASGLDASKQLIYAGNVLNIPVTCYCGDPSISPAYGLFATYVVQPQDQLTTLASNFSLGTEIISEFNSGVNSSQIEPYSTIFIPTRDLNGSFPPFNGTLNSTSVSIGTSKTNIGVIVGVAVGVTVLAVVLLFIIFLRRKLYLRSRKPAKEFEKQESVSFHLTSESLSESNVSRTASPVMGDLKSVEFTYEELAVATDNFHVSHKIGQGGFASVYYGLIRNQKLAIKKMNTQATKEFLAELQVLTNVHHTNLVQLIGFCTTTNLFLVYEFIENGTLDHHLHRKDFHEKPPLSWTQRVEIALDAARGLEYIHEHIKPTYIHRDIKTANILIDGSFRAKVADFGLAKLTESGSGTGIVGTFGYMPPEYALYGEVSPKVDVFAFGVVLFEIISGRVALPGLVSHSESLPRSREGRTLTSLFESTLNDPNGKIMLHRHIDPALKDDYPIDAVWKMAQLARRCTQESPELRPSMRYAVVQLMTLASATQEWDRGDFVDKNS
ncbi:hypothetical protein M758_3G211600 [Ceratodon purpureus]|nr:hypothetical protein M758_3G211600 [Ceratodon purpureus]